MRDQTNASFVLDERLAVIGALEPEPGFVSGWLKRRGDAAGNTKSSSGPCMYSIDCGFVKLLQRFVAKHRGTLYIGVGGSWQRLAYAPHPPLRDPLLWRLHHFRRRVSSRKPGSTSASGACQTHGNDGSVLFLHKKYIDRGRDMGPRPGRSNAESTCR